METQASNPNANLKYDYQSLDEHLSTVLPHEDLRYWLNEIECELLSSREDHLFELAVDNRVWETFALLKNLLPVRLPEDKN